MNILKKNCQVKKIVINSDKDYEHAVKFWNAFERKTMTDYVMLIADVFEKFRNNSLNNYGLCLSHY